MSLAARLGPLPSTQCVGRACCWYRQLDPDDKKDVDTWLSMGGSLTGLWRAACETVEPDGTAVKDPLRVGLSSFKVCIAHAMTPKVRAKRQESIAAGFGGISRGSGDSV